MDLAEGLSAYRPESAAFAAGRIMVQGMRALSGQREDFAFETTRDCRAAQIHRWILFDNGSLAGLGLMA